MIRIERIIITLLTCVIVGLLIGGASIEGFGVGLIFGLIFGVLIGLSAAFDREPGVPRG
jgi:preprotein translocase subunit SecF